MTPREDNQKTTNCIDHVTLVDSATAKAIAEFVRGHRETLNYLVRFGSPIEKAKADLFLQIAGECV